MRIACVTSSWPTEDNPSAGAFVREHTQLLRDAGHDVVVFTWRAGVEGPDVVEVSPLGRRSVFSGTGAPDALERSPARVLEAPLAITAMLGALRRHGRFDLYLGHWFVPGGLVARLAGELFSAPSAVIGHSGGIHAVLGSPRPMRTALLRTIVRPNTTTVPSAALAERLGGGVDVLPMGFEATGARSRGSGVLCYGRLVELKGFDRALRAMQPGDVHVLGDGPERERLRNIAPDAKFWGWADLALKREVLPLCGRALFPSRVRPGGRHEGWPVSVLEVSAAGIVPFVSSWPGAAELVVSPDLQVVDDWAVAAKVDVDALREDTRRHAAQYTWTALGPRWIDWVERAASR